MSAYTTMERIATLRQQAQKHRQAAHDARRYEISFHESEKARHLDRQADALESETIEEI